MLCWYWDSSSSFIFLSSSPACPVYFGYGSFKLTKTSNYTVIRLSVYHYICGKKMSHLRNSWIEYYCIQTMLIYRKFYQGCKQNCFDTKMGQEVPKPQHIQTAVLHTAYVLLNTGDVTSTTFLCSCQYCNTSQRGPSFCPSLCNTRLPWLNCDW